MKRDSDEIYEYLTYPVGAPKEIRRELLHVHRILTTVSVSHRIKLEKHR